MVFSTPNFEPPTEPELRLIARLVLWLFLGLGIGLVAVSFVRTEDGAALRAMGGVCLLLGLVLALAWRSLLGDR